MFLRDESSKDKHTLKPWQLKLHQIIFEAETPSGRFFDVVLLWAILLSIFIVSLESVESIQKDYGFELRIVEWIFTALFTREDVARILSVARPSRYIFSFLGIVDLVAVLPTYAALFLTNSQYFIVIRSIRLLRVFRILKLARYQSAAYSLLIALRASLQKITVFLGAVLTLVVIMGTIMHIIEGENSQFTSIPKSIYWAIVTLTTVGYGDIAPQTPVGQAVAALIMIMGYSIIAVPTGIVSAEIARETRLSEVRYNNVACSNCQARGHESDAQFCRFCGTELPESEFIGE